jgi:hypothetical protein
MGFSAHNRGDSFAKPLRTRQNGTNRRDPDLALTSQHPRRITVEEHHVNHSTTVYTNARVVTMNPAQPRAEALAIANGRIVAVGSVKNVGDRIGTSVTTVDLAGATVVPGLNDCHMHILSYGLQLGQVDLTAIESIADLTRVLVAGTTDVPSDEWIRGRGYSHDSLTERRHPARQDLDTVSRNHPVVVTHTSGHVLSCNSVALALAGINGNTLDPPGGEIERMPGGEPTGVLKETAMPLVLGIVPAPTADAASAAISRATKQLAREGITSASDAATGHDLGMDKELAAYMSALDADDAALRIVLMPEIGYVAPPDGDGAIETSDLAVGPQIEWLRIGATKIFTDGAITTRTAALRAPYEGSDNTGLPTWERQTLENMILRAHLAGWQIATHAMGDLAIEMTIAAYESAQTAAPRHPRHRIEHCSLPDGELCDRIVALGVVPVLQPELLARFGDSYVEGLGVDRAANAMPVGWLRNHKVHIAFSSDRPVISGNPLFGVRSAMTRRSPSGRILGIEHSVTATEALESYTTGAAYATFTERDKGRLIPGYLADFTVLDADLTAMRPEEITGAAVLMTVVGGRVSFQAA